MSHRKCFQPPFRARDGAVSTGTTKRERAWHGTRKATWFQNFLVCDRLSKGLLYTLKWLNIIIGYYYYTELQYITTQNIFAVSSAPSLSSLTPVRMTRPPPRVCICVVREREGRAKAGGGACAATALPHRAAARAFRHSLGGQRLGAFHGSSAIVAMVPLRGQARVSPWSDSHGSARYEPSPNMETLCTRIIA